MQQRILEKKSHQCQLLRACGDFFLTNSRCNGLLLLLKSRKRHRSIQIHRHGCGISQRWSFSHSNDTKWRGIIDGESNDFCCFEIEMNLLNFCPSETFLCLLCLLAVISNRVNNICTVCLVHFQLPEILQPKNKLNLRFSARNLIHLNASLYSPTSCTRPSR